MSNPTSAQSYVTASKSIAKPRLALIDTAKGVGILLIVLGHNTLFGDYFPALSDGLMSFRLPFFFMISGVMLSLKDHNLGRIAYLRADAWLKPCAVVVIVFGLAKVVRGSAEIEGLLVALSFATGFTFAWTPLWFLPHLWLLYVAAAAILMYGQTLLTSNRNKALLLVVLCISGFAISQLYRTAIDNEACVKQLTFSMELFDCGLPFSADLLPTTLFFFLGGYFLRERIKAFVPTLFTAACALAMVILLREEFPYKFDLNTRQYANILITPMQAIIGIYAMLCICYYLARSDLMVKIFGYFGRTSLFILIFHAPVQYILLRALPRWIHSDGAVAVISFVTAIAIALMLYHLCKKSSHLSSLMLPLKRARPRP